MHIQAVHMGHKGINIHSSFKTRKRLTSITIPSSVTSFGEGVFSDCSSLETINYSGTTSQWNSIEKGKNWDDGWEGLTEVVCSNGTIEVDNNGGGDNGGK